MDNVKILFTLGIKKKKIVELHKNNKVKVLRKENK